MFGRLAMGFANVRAGTRVLIRGVLHSRLLEPEQNDDGEGTSVAHEHVEEPGRGARGVGVRASTSTSGPALPVILLIPKGSTPSFLIAQGGIGPALPFSV